MAARRHSAFNKIKATCDELKMTEMMSFKYIGTRKSSVSSMPRCILMLMGRGCYG
jgi:hypothetical protein